MKIKALKIKPIMPYIVTKAISTRDKYWKCPPIEFDVKKGGEKCMQESKYEVIVDNMVVAEGMNIDTATVLVKAFFKEYYNDHSMTISIREMERTEGVCEDGTK